MGQPIGGGGCYSETAYGYYFVEGFGEMMRVLVVIVDYSDRQRRREGVARLNAHRRKM